MITISNTTVHQAGAVGTPCFVMLSKIPQWRYGLKNDMNYWYQNNYLIRQKPNDKDWQPVVRRTAKKVQQWVSDTRKS